MPIIPSNAYDEPVTTPERQLRVIHACQIGAIELLMTHAQVDELQAMPDSEKCGRILAIPFNLLTRNLAPRQCTTQARHDLGHIEDQRGLIFEMESSGACVRFSA